MLVITMGEVLGTNAELLAGLLTSDQALTELAARQPVCVVGSASHLADQTARLGLSLPPLRRISKAGDLGRHGLHLLDVDPQIGVPFAPAEQLAESIRGKISVLALQGVGPLTDLAERRAEKLAVLTGPIDKHACQLAGFAHPGQTEYFEGLWNGTAVMILAGPKLRVGLATNHLALRDVPAHVSQALIETKLHLLCTSLQRYFHVARPKIAVAALNPHAGDGGMFGDEDARVVQPAVAGLQARGFAVEGPFPADTVFYRAYHGRYDAVLAMYHDQGLGPLKTVHFDDGVNLSGGLRHLRVSPDHGPARDLFLQRKASPESWRHALGIAVSYLNASI